ncbi:lipocalin family protein [Tenacibaculum sp. FZY0031]|uniref:lipocalin family protein n=1 Tax=unclassified Tenacibaculum TaxID=2635139 RepID=UPI002EBB3B4C|nr:lipocalin family protein [Tenacibaculum sp. FZY0031]
MKKNLILTIAMFSLLACSSDDENNLDPIVGTWYFFSDSGVEVDECNKRSTILFNDNGTFSSTNYGNQDDPNNCVIENKDSGTWINNSNNKYQITDIKTNTKQIYTITFSDNGNSFMSETNGFGDTINIQVFKRK